MQSGIHVVLFNRDVKPGGLAEFGIFLETYKKYRTRTQFRQILVLDSVNYIRLLPGKNRPLLPQLRPVIFHKVHLILLEAAEKDGTNEPGGLNLRYIQ